MPKLTEYTAATSFDVNDILIKDGTGGTKKISIENVVSYLYQQLADTTLADTEKFAQAKAVGDALTALGADITSLGTEASAIKAMLAPEEAGSTATRNYTAGEFLVTGDKLYKVTANIANGGSIVANLNVTETTIGAQLTALQSGYASLSTTVSELASIGSDVDNIKKQLAAMEDGTYVVETSDAASDFFYAIKDSSIYVKNIKLFTAYESYRSDLSPSSPVTIGIGARKYVKLSAAKGKNLFNPNCYNESAVTSTSGSTLVGTSTKHLWVPIVGGKTYTVSAPNRKNNIFKIIATDKFPSIIAGSTIAPVYYEDFSNGGATAVTFTLPKTAKWLGVIINSGGEELTPKLIGLQIEEGSSATAYEEFQGTTINIPLKNGSSYLSINYGEIDIKNQKIIDDGSVKILNGSEEWTTVGSGSSAYYTCVLNIPVPSASLPGLCSRFPWVNITETGAEEGICVVPDSGTARIKVRPGSLLTSEQGGTVEAFKAWLASFTSDSTRVKIIYHVATPVEFDLNSEVVSQIETLKTGVINTCIYVLSYSDINNATDEVASYIGSNCSIQFGYSIDLKGYVDDKLAELAALIPTT